MAEISKKLKEFLSKERVHYEKVHHPTDYTARETAADTHTPNKEFAKTVFLRIDGSYAMAVLPADEFVSFKRVRGELDAEEVRLATEPESRRLCPDCDVGAAPPFGNLYDLPVYVSTEIAEDERITFNAGSHEEAIRLPYRDFERLVHPRVIPLSKHD
jgi:Ala-tRNA(Pro) deacylase